MRERIFKVFVVIFMILLVSVLSACGKSEPTAEKTGEPEYAGAMTESILKAFNSDDYTAYSQDFDEAMKKAMPESTFEQTRAQIQEAWGEYESKEYSGVEENVQGIYTAVTYKATFRKKSGVQVRVVFLETDDKVLVSGLWFQ
jgi:major membrane immunogen (membrane-anchored lipoprotein)